MPGLGKSGIWRIWSLICIGPRRLTIVWLTGSIAGRAQRRVGRHLEEHVVLEPRFPLIFTFHQYPQIAPIYNPCNLWIFFCHAKRRSRVFTDPERSAGGTG